MKKQWIFAATVSAIALSSGFALAQSNAAPTNGSALSFDEAVAIALAEKPGSVVEVERDREDGRDVIEVELVTDAGEEIEVYVDAQSGEVVSIEAEDEDEYEDDEDEDEDDNDNDDVDEDDDEDEDEEGEDSDEDDDAA